jgi:hypothetical protein
MSPEGAAGTPPAASRAAPRGAPVGIAAPAAGDQPTSDAGHCRRDSGHAGRGRVVIDGPDWATGRSRRRRRFGFTATTRLRTGAPAGRLPPRQTGPASAASARPGWGRSRSRTAVDGGVNSSGTAAAQIRQRCPVDWWSPPAGGSRGIRSGAARSGRRSRRPVAAGVRRRSGEPFTAWRPPQALNKAINFQSGGARLGPHRHGWSRGSWQPPGAEASMSCSTTAARALGAGAAGLGHQPPGLAGFSAASSGPPRRGGQVGGIQRPGAAAAAGAGAAYPGRRRSPGRAKAWGRRRRRGAGSRQPQNTSWAALRVPRGRRQPPAVWKTSRHATMRGLKASCRRRGPGAGPPARPPPDRNGPPPRSSGPSSIAAVPPRCSLHARWLLHPGITRRRPKTWSQLSLRP